MLLQISDHCNKYHLQPDYQSAYREHYSCETAILHISDNILWAMEKQCITSLIAMDLLAAFDTVDHDILLAIHKTKFGIEDKALKWFDSYLHPRSYMGNNQWQVQQRSQLRCKCTTRQLCRCKHLQPLMLPCPRSGTR